MSEEKLEKTKKNNKGQEANDKSKRKKERNDINEKKLKQGLEEDIADVMVWYYTNAKNNTAEVQRFVNYLRHCSKDNKSNNSFVNRVYGLYQYLTEQYSNFKELDKILNVK